MKPVERNRATYEASGKKLRRARRIFVFFQRNYIVTTIDLHRMAMAMLDHKLYAATDPRSAKYAILRYLWKFDGGHDRPWPNPEDWHHWCRSKGWNVAHRCKEEAAA